MLRLAYNALLLPLALLALPLTVAGLLFRPRLRQGLRERFAALPARESETVWVHAASVGEAEAAAPLVRALLEAGRAVVATSMTVTGRERLRALVPDAGPRLAPLDLPGLVDSSLRRARVATLLLIETEIWPNLILAARARGVRAAIVGGRLSDAGYAGYRRAGGFVGALLRRLDVIAARSADDRERFVRLGAAESSCRVTGDLKLSVARVPSPPPELCAALGPGPFLLAGSTHPGEEEALLDAWRALRERAEPGARLILAPRHPERARAVCGAALRQGALGALRSGPAAGAEVVVLDTLGELASLYALARVVFVGGSLQPIGGHNLLEPVRAGRVAIHGPHMHNQRAQLELLRPFGALESVADSGELAEAVVRLWKDPERDAPARAALRALDPDAVLRRSLEAVFPGEFAGA
ncbi:MAG: 3-deoxy-D-manno-octulosonic acid transferase [Proteobacteria bacterium]|nr:3-deoxy-D-manno-octulosonic acid transferase [Pseudomonadota bacterium]